MFWKGSKGEKGDTGADRRPGKSIRTRSSPQLLQTKCLLLTLHVCVCVFYIAVVRLVGSFTRGRLEVFYQNVWGSVCDDNFDSVDATVVCKMLGFQRSTQVYTASGGAVSVHAQYLYMTLDQTLNISQTYLLCVCAAGAGQIWLDEVRCSGQEKSIFDCIHGGMGNHNCNHNEDVGISCA